MDKVIFLNGPKVRLELTPDDWNLNTVEDPELEQERDMIADLLNQDMADLIAECPGRKDIQWRDLQDILGPFRSWGISSALGNETVESILDTVYGDI